MTSRRVSAACGRIVLGLTLLSAALPLSAANAQNRPVGAPAVPAAAAPAKPHILNAQKQLQHQQPAIDNDATPSAEAPKSSAPAIEATAEQKADVQEPVRAATVTIAAKPEGRKKRADYVAAGCSPGKLCIVCVAGCPERAGTIVHAAVPQATSD